MRDILNTETLFYLGILVLAGAAALGCIQIIFFRITGKRIRKKLEQEYGKPWKESRTA